MATSTLTPKQRRFVDEYLIDLNAAGAARRAGYSPKTANSIACENLMKPNIQQEISRAMEEREKKTGVTAEQIVEELSKIAFSDFSGFAEWNQDGFLTIKDSSKLTPGQRACIAEISSTKGKTVKLKLYSKEKSLELLGRHLGMFRENLNISNQETQEDWVDRWELEGEEEERKKATETITIKKSAIRHLMKG